MDQEKIKKTCSRDPTKNLLKFGLVYAPWFGFGIDKITVSDRKTAEIVQFLSGNSNMTRH